VPAQLASIKALIDVEFDWLLPAHGGALRFESQSKRRAMLVDAADAFTREGGMESMLTVGYF